MSLLLSPLAVAQMPGMSPSRNLEAKDEGASQLDKIGVMVDRDLEFRDERGYPYTLKQLFPGKHPVVLLLGYYSCPAMCGGHGEGRTTSDMTPDTNRKAADDACGSASWSGG